LEYDQHYQQIWSQSIGPFDQNRPYIEILVEILNKDRILEEPICCVDIIMTLSW
jgi:hypothetical protein